MKEYTKRDSCMTMEEVIERNTGMSLKAFLTPQPNPYIHNMDRAVEFFKKKVNDAAVLIAAVNRKGILFNPHSFFNSLTIGLTYLVYSLVLS